MGTAEPPANQLVIKALASACARTRHGGTSANISLVQRTATALAANATGMMASASARWATLERPACKPSGVLPSLTSTPITPTGGLYGTSPGGSLAHMASSSTVSSAQAAVLSLASNLEHVLLAVRAMTMSSSSGTAIMT